MKQMVKPAAYGTAHAVIDFGTLAVAKFRVCSAKVALQATPTVLGSK